MACFGIWLRVKLQKIFFAVAFQFHFNRRGFVGMQIALHDKHAFFELARKHFQRAERFADGLADDVAVSINLQMHGAAADL